MGNALGKGEVQVRASRCYAEGRCFITLQQHLREELGHMFHPDAGTNVLVEQRFCPKPKQEAAGAR